MRVEGLLKRLILEWRLKRNNNFNCLLFFRIKFYLYLVYICLIIKILLIEVMFGRIFSGFLEVRGPVMDDMNWV